MTHQFNTKLAKKVGIEAAIIYQNVCFWVQHNEANNTNFINGHFWTYNSWDAWTELFPYMGKYTIKSALKKLKDAKLIKWETGINPANKWDKTAYYRVVDWSHFDIGKNQTSTGENIEHHYRSDINTDINTPNPLKGADENFPAQDECSGADGQNKKHSAAGKEKIPRHKPKGYQYPADFEELWKLYRRGDKWAAYKAWLKRKDDYTPAELKKALRAEMDKTIGKRHFSTVLNGDIDELIAQYDNPEVDGERLIFM